MRGIGGAAGRRRGRLAHAHGAAGELGLQLGEHPRHDRPDLDRLAARGAQTREGEHVLEQSIHALDRLAGERREARPQLRVLEQGGEVIGEGLDRDQRVAELVRQLGEQVLERRVAGRRRRCGGHGGGGLGGEVQVGGLDDAAGQEERAREHGLELGHVPGPGMRGEAVERVRGKARRRDAEPAPEPLEHGRRERRQLCGARGERRDREHDGGEARGEGAGQLRPRVGARQHPHPRVVEEGLEREGAVGRQGRGVEVERRSRRHAVERRAPAGRHHERPLATCESVEGARQEEPATRRGSAQQDRDRAGGRPAGERHGRGLGGQARRGEHGGRRRDGERRQERRGPCFRPRRHRPAAGAAGNGW